MPGQSWCKSSVSKHSRIRLSLPFPVCASLDFGIQVRSYIHIRYTLYMLKRQPSSAVIGKQKVNRFFVKFFSLHWLLDNCKTFDFVHGSTEQKDSSNRAGIKQSQM